METPERRASGREALLPTPVGVSRFVIRATQDRGVGVSSSRSLATTSREAVLNTAAYRHIPASVRPRMCRPFWRLSAIRQRRGGRRLARSREHFVVSSFGRTVAGRPVMTDGMSVATGMLRPERSREQA